MAKGPRIQIGRIYRLTSRLTDQVYISYTLGSIEAKLAEVKQKTQSFIRNECVFNPIFYVTLCREFQIELIAKVPFTSEEDIIERVNELRNLRNVVEDDDYF